LPIRKLKIDRSFIRDIPSDPDVRTVIEAVIAMAHAMRVRVLAVGVETEEQLSFLRAAQCDEAQGYLFDGPLTAEQFNELVTSGM
ncbi:MAG TPA: EAL domain-containing protein, partial [Dissulfurispiraceae bacterium]